MQGNIGRRRGSIQGSANVVLILRNFSDLASLMLLSNLYAYVEALGGEVEIRAKFPEQEVRITQFKEIEKLKVALTPKAKQKRPA